MERVDVLVDLANTHVFRGIHRPNPAVIGARLDEFLLSIAERSRSIVGDQFCEFHVRLYDGWFDAGGVGTDLYDMLRLHMRGNYPTRLRHYRMFVSIADAPLAASEDRLLHTYREQRGLTRHHIAVAADQPLSCVAPASCGIAQLRSWIKGRCPAAGCLVSAEDAAYFRQQKLVDTALVADVVWGASQGRTMVVVSDDEDVIPGLLTARWFGRPVAWVCRAGEPREPYAVLIGRRGVECLAC